MDVSGKKGRQLATAHKAKEANMPESKGNDGNENAFGILLHQRRSVEKVEQPHGTDWIEGAYNGWI